MCNKLFWYQMMNSQRKTLALVRFHYFVHKSKIMCFWLLLLKPSYRQFSTCTLSYGHKDSYERCVRTNLPVRTNSTNSLFLTTLRLPFNSKDQLEAFLRKWGAFLSPVCNSRYFEAWVSTPPPPPGGGDRVIYFPTMFWWVM